MKAILSIGVENPWIGEALVAAVTPDNQSSPLTSKIRGRWEAGKIVFELRGIRSIGTLISTVDDLLACLEAAYETLRVLHLEGGSPLTPNPVKS